MKYRVLRAFRAVYGEQEYSGLPGQVVELSEEIAGWLERDSPGRIAAVEDRPKTEDRGPEERAVEAAPRDRMQRRGKNR